jgi:hypothetical protein
VSIMSYRNPDLLPSFVLRRVQRARKQFTRFAPASSGASSILEASHVGTNQFDFSMQQPPRVRKIRDAIRIISRAVSIASRHARSAYKISSSVFRNFCLS